MQNKNLIAFAEEKVEQFKMDLLNAKPEDNPFNLIMVSILNDKKNQHWDEIMEKLQEFSEPNYLDQAYDDMSKYHTQFQRMLKGFIQNTAEHYSEK